MHHLCPVCNANELFIRDLPRKDGSQPGLKVIRCDACGYQELYELWLEMTREPYMSPENRDFPAGG